MSSDTENTALWDKVFPTDPRHVKKITGKPYQGNSPRPHYVVWRATQAFGPCGIGWGFNIIKREIVEGAPGEKVDIAHVRVWYHWNGKHGEVEHVGQTVFSGKRKTGEPFTDEDAPKKSVSDALTKALSLVGFSGDIFMGRYDDSKYVADTLAAIKEEERSGEAEYHPNQSEMVAGALTQLELAARKGVVALQEAWKSIGPENQRALTGEKERLKKIASGIITTEIGDEPPES